MSEAQLLNDARLAVINAPFDPSGWEAAIDMVARASGASGANLVGFGGSAGLSVNLFSGGEQDRAQEYFARPELWGPCNWRINSTGAGALTIQHDADYAAYRATAVTADYDDAVSDLDMQYGCQSALIQDSRSFLGVALFRGRRQGPCDASMLDRFTFLSREIHRAVRLQLALAGEAAELLLGELSSISTPTLLIDRYGYVSAMTPAAETLAEEGGPIRLCGLSLQFRDRHENRRVLAEMGRMLQLGPHAAGRRVFELPVGRTEAAPAGRWVASIVRLPQRDHGLGFDPQLALSFAPLQWMARRPPVGVHEAA